MATMKAAKATKPLKAAMKVLKKPAKAKTAGAMKVLKQPAKAKLSETDAETEGDPLLNSDEAADGHAEAGWKNVFVQRVPAVWIDETGTQGPVGATWSISSAQRVGSVLLVEWHEGRS